MNLIECIGVFMDILAFQKHLSKFMAKMAFSIWCKEYARILLGLWLLKWHETLH